MPEFLAMLVALLMGVLPAACWWFAAYTADGVDGRGVFSTICASCHIASAALVVAFQVPLATLIPIAASVLMVCTGWSVYRAVAGPSWYRDDAISLMAAQLAGLLVICAICVMGLGGDA